MCCFGALLGRRSVAIKCNCGYKCVVDESRSRRSLADDPSFLASLADLDAGVTDAVEFPLEADNVPASAPPAPAQRPVRAPTRAAPVQPSVAGLELFPPAMLVPDSSTPAPSP